MTKLDRRRRVVAIAGGMVAISGALVTFVGHHRAGEPFDVKHFALGVGVGITFGLVMLLLAKMSRRGTQDRGAPSFEDPH